MRKRSVLLKFAYLTPLLATFAPSGWSLFRFKNEVLLQTSFFSCFTQRCIGPLFVFFHFHHFFIDFCWEAFSLKVLAMFSRPWRSLFALGRFFWNQSVWLRLKKWSLGACKDSKIRKSVIWLRTPIFFKIVRFTCMPAIFGTLWVTSWAPGGVWKISPWPLLAADMA